MTVWKSMGEKKRSGTLTMSQWFYVTGDWLAAYTREALWLTALEWCCARQEDAAQGLWRMCKWLILYETLEMSNNLESDQKLLVVTTNPYHSSWFVNYPTMTHTFLNSWILFRFCTLLVKQPVPLQTNPELLKVRNQIRDHHCTWEWLAQSWVLSIWSWK